MCAFNPWIMKIAFVCMENAGRSQMAAALSGQIVSNDFEVISSGSTPSEEVRKI